MDFGRGSFAHRDEGIGAVEAVGEEEPSQAAFVTDSSGDAGEERLERGPGGVGKDEDGVETLLADMARDLEDGVGPFESEQGIEVGEVAPEVCEPIEGKEGDAGVGVGFADPPERGAGHDGVTQPVYAPDEDRFGWGLGGHFAVVGQVGI